MSDKHQVYFKNPDIIFEIIEARPDYQQGDFADEYFDGREYGVIEIDAKTLACRLLPRDEWEEEY